MAPLSTVFDRYRVPANPLRTERQVELAAVLLTGVLIVLVLYGVVRLSVGNSVDAILPAAETLQVGELQPPGVVSPQQSDELRARPVFWPSRRPAQELAAEDIPSKEKPKPKAKSELDKVKVLGIVGSGESAVVIALVEGKKRRILLGDEVVGWRLDSVARGQAVFADSGRSQTLSLKYSSIAEQGGPAANNTNDKKSSKKLR